MLNQVYRLVSARQFEVQIINEKINNDTLIIRPTYLSICVADQRYFTGERDKKVLVNKLPMALIHEGVGKVIHDPKGEFKKMIELLWFLTHQLKLILLLEKIIWKLQNFALVVTMAIHKIMFF